MMRPFLRFSLAGVAALVLMTASAVAAVPKAAESPDAPVTTAPAQMPKPAAKKAGKESRKALPAARKAKSKAARKTGKKKNRR